MQQFTGTEYLQIDIANYFGKDKENWDTRINWVNEKSLFELWNLTPEAKKPIAYQAALHAFEDCINGIPSGHMIELDACSSGFQLMAVLTGCHTSAKQCGVINTGKREDAYMNIFNNMNKHLPKENQMSLTGENGIAFADVKQAAMTKAYDSTAQPKKTFGEDTPELEEFYETMYELLPGVMDMLETAKACWQSNAYYHKWTLPDGCVAKVPIIDKEFDVRIEVDELNHSTFTHRAKINTPMDTGQSLCANIVHSVDAYVCREVIRRCYHNHGITVLTIHDAFRCHPNHGNEVRKYYLEVLIEIAKSNLLENILNEITGTKEKFHKQSTDLAEAMTTAEYHLS